MDTDLHLPPSHLPSAIINLKLIAKIPGQEHDLCEPVSGDLDQKMVQKGRPIYRQQWFRNAPSEFAETAAEAANQNRTRLRHVVFGLHQSVARMSSGRFSYLG